MQTETEGRDVIKELRAVIVDDRTAWVGAVARVLTELGVVIVGRESNLDELAALESASPDLVILRLEAGNAKSTEAGIACIAKIRQRLQDARVIVFGDSAEPTQIDAVFAAGASAFVVKTAALSDVASAIRQSFYQSVHFGHSPRSFAPSPSHRGTAANLTRREREVLVLIGDGMTNAQVAKTLFVTEQTVKFHLANIYRKLNVSNRTEASRWAQAYGLLGPQP